MGAALAALDATHLRAALRLALRVRGFTLRTSDIERAIEERARIGRWLRDQALPSRLPTFVTTADYHAVAQADPLLWDCLPRMLGFGYQQAEVLQHLAARPPAADDGVATLGAAFSAGIALVDHLVDTRPDGGRVFEILNRDTVRGMFDPAVDASTELGRAYQGAADPGLRLLCALVAACGVGFRELHRRSGNDAAWAELGQVIGRMYEAERTVSSARPTSRAELRDLLPAIQAKSVLPFVAMHHLVALAAPEPRASGWGRVASTTLGRVVSLTDDLVDLPDDCHRAVPNGIILALADRLWEQRRTWPSDADVYEVVDDGVVELLDLLRPRAFGLTGHEATPSAAGQAGSVEPLTWATNVDSGGILDFARLTVASWVGWHEDGASAGPPSHTGSDLGVSATPSNPTAAATEMLLAQQRDDYREAVHRLRLPRLSTEGLRLETHPALLFQRAIVLDGLLDAWDAGHSVPRRALDTEAWAILRAKHRSARGGWNYVPEVPELPPDADDLGMVLQVLCRVGGPVLAAACDDAIRLALAAMEPDGGVPTWILDPADHSGLGEMMRAYVDVTGSGGVHPDVVANLLAGLILYDAARYRSDLIKAAAYLEAAQDERGAWASRWYAGPYYGTFRAVSALSRLVPDSAALERTRDFLLRGQRPDGGWGEVESDPLATAFAVLGLAAVGERWGDPAIDGGVTYLVSAQEADGGWAAGPFIAFPTSDGLGVHTYASRTITTVFCLKALLAATSVTGAAAAGAGPLAGYPWPAKPVSPASAGGWG